MQDFNVMFQVYSPCKCKCHGVLASSRYSCVSYGVYVFLVGQMLGVYLSRNA